MVSSWIYAHRGLWDDPLNQNTFQSLRSAGEHGFSLETDIREHSGDVVISHDPAQSNFLSLSSFQDIFKFNSVALNIKCDGISNNFEIHREGIEDSGSFFFDGSIPEMYKYKNLGLPHALRLSEYEKDLAWGVKIIWLDSFVSDWFISNLDIRKLLEDHKVILVSPELHGREPRFVWEWFLNIRNDFENFSICTDFPKTLLGLL